MNGPIRIAVIEGNDVVRDGLAALLARRPDLIIAGEFRDVNESIAGMRTHATDVVIIDQGLGEASAAALCREIAEHKLAGHVVVLSAELDHAVAEQAILAGARGYVVKDVDCDHLARAIDVVARGGIYLDAKIGSRTNTRSFLDGATSPPEPSRYEESVADLAASPAGNDRGGVGHA